MRRYCLLAPDTLSRLVHDALLRLLDCALRYAWLSMQLAKAGAVAEAARTAGPLAAQSGVSLVRLIRLFRFALPLHCVRAALT